MIAYRANFQARSVLRHGFDSLQCAKLLHLLALLHRLHVDYTAAVGVPQVLGCIDGDQLAVIDYREALKWLRRASAQGLPEAQFCLGSMYEVGEGVPESDEIAARWYRKAADHFTDVSGVWEAEVQMNYMYRDGRLRKDYVEAYMWAAIVGFSANPPADSDMKRTARNMTKAQIAEAQRRAEDWIKRHRSQPQNVLAQPAKN